MKMQFTYLVTLAVLCGSVSATPIPAEATENAGPGSATDAVLGAGGNILGALYRLLAPGAALGGAARGAGAYIPGYRRDEASEVYGPGSLTDDVLGAGGDVLGTLYRLLAPGAALGGAAHGAGAYIPGYRRDEAAEAYGPSSATDAVLGGAGNIIGTLYRLLAPGAALGGAAHGAGAYIPGYRRDEAAATYGPSSLTDDVLGAGGDVLGTLYRLLAPGAALGGAAHGAGAYIPGYRRDEATEAAGPGSATDAVLDAGGDILGTLYRLLAPGAALGGAARGAGAYIPGYRRDEATEANGWGDDDDDASGGYRRDEATKEAGPSSATDAVLGAGGDILGDLYRLLAPSAALRGAARGAGAFLPGY